MASLAVALASIQALTPLPAYAQDPDPAAVPPAVSGVPAPVRAFGRAVEALGRDFWVVLTSPVRMDGRDWLATAGVVAAASTLYGFDGDIHRAAVRNRDAPVVGQIVDVGTFLEPLGNMGNTNVWYASAAVVSWAAGWERPNRLFTEILYSHWIAAVVRGGANRLVERSRPFEDMGPRHFGDGGTSFPSGHASSIFQIAAVLSHHAGSTPASVALYGAATTVAWQRLESEQHWASDVLIGAAYGWAVARVVIRLHEADALRVRPAVDAAGRPAVALVVPIGGGGPTASGGR